METKTDIINRVAVLYSLNTSGAGLTEKHLAKFILKNYYDVESFFLVREGDYSSGLNLESFNIFCENMKNVTKAIEGGF
jgi:hypothetical protein